MSNPPDFAGKINISMASVLLLESSNHGLEILSQIVKGFGAREVHRCSSVDEAERVLTRGSVDLFLIDPSLANGDDGYAFIKWLRTAGPEKSRGAPIVLLSGHASRSSVARGRDTGANFFLVKPVSPKKLIERLLWIERDRRPFVEISSGYCGPDRRFKYDGPPGGGDGRRSDDLNAPIGDAQEPNISQDELESLLKPQRVVL